MKNNLEARVESLERRVAALENQITNKVSSNNRLEQLAENLLSDALQIIKRKDLKSNGKIP